MRPALWIAALVLLLAGCAPEAFSLAERAAFETSLTTRCLAFDQARSKAHARLADIPAPDLERLHEINQAGRVICHQSIDDLTSEIVAINAKLP